MNVFQVFTEHVRSAVTTLAQAGVFPSPPDLSRIVVEPPREASHGDLATNAAMALAKDEGSSRVWPRSQPNCAGCAGN
jgi:arginyl-tRNA synthetase